MKTTPLFIKRPWPLFLIALHTTFVLSGCFPVPERQSVTYAVNILNNQNTWENHQRLVDLVKSDNKLIDTMTPPQIYVWCSSSFSVRDYNSFFQCAETLIPVANKSNWQPTLVHDAEYGFVTTSWEHVYATILTRRALMNLELGNLKEAETEATEAVALLEQGKAGSSFLDKGRRERLFDMVQAYRAYGLTKVAQGKNDDVDQAMKGLEDQTSALNVEFKKMKTAAIAHILMAQKDYLGAKKTIGLGAGITAGEAGGLVLMTAVGAVFAVAGSGEGVRAIWEAGKAAYKLSSDDVFANFFNAKIFYETGDEQAAKELYDALLARSDLLKITGLKYTILYDRGQIAASEGNQELAIDYMKQAVAVIESQRSTINIEAGKIGFLGDKLEVYHGLIKTLFDAGLYEEAFEYAERAKARALVDMLASKKEFTGGNRKNAVQLAELLKEMGPADITLARNDTPQAGQPLTRGISIAQTELKETDAELSSLVTVTPTKVQELLQLIPTDETLLEFYEADGQFYAFVLTNQGLKGFKLEAKQVSQDVELFRNYIQTSPDNARGIKVKATVDQGADTSKTLYASLIKPLAGSINTRNLTIVPHGALHYLPFAALNDGSQYLIDNFNLRVLPSASVLTFLKDQKTGHAGKLLAFGNPDLADPAMNLPGAEAESKAIAAKIAGATLFTGKQATETTAKNIGGEYRYVHFASHGTFNPDEPLSSGLLLTADGENDGTLTVRELYDLNLPADLVTLSACETALGKIANGDDVVGFTRGFLYAGTSSIVSSLWKVDDQATSQLMQEFYDNLGKSNKRDALRTAQLHIKDHYNTHPYYWAAFQLTGNVN